MSKTFVRLLKRRDFLSVSGATILSGGGALSISRRPVIGVEFDLTVPNVKPSAVENITLNFTKLQLTPQYIDDSEKLEVKLETGLENYNVNATATTTEQITNGDTTDISGQTPELKLNLPSISNDQDILQGFIRIKIDHPSVSETYRQSFNIDDLKIPETDYTRNAISRWLMNEGQGSTATDRLGNRDLTLNGVTWNENFGVQGNYINFDGSDGTANNPNTPILGSQNRTFSCWINPDSTSNNHTLCHFGGDKFNNSSARWTFHIRPEGLRIEVEGNGYTSDLQPSTNSWQLVACILDGNQLGDHTLYLDGSTESTSGSISVNTTDNDGLDVGHILDIRHFDGGMSDAILSDRAASVSELNRYRTETESNYN